MVVGENKRASNIMDGIENTGDVRLHDHRLRLKQRFDIVRKLGQGTYGKVQLGINKKTGQEVAIKTIKKCKIESEADLVRIRREVQIMSSVRHPNIVHIYEVFENSEKMILVMEYCSGGELYDYLSQKKVLQEDEARRLFRQIATAVYYCHIHKICHRDLKLENVLLDDTGSAKIADFGLSNVFKETSLLSTFCGSPLYASPEIVKGTPYIGPEVDCWSLGVLLYTLVYGAMPFDGSNFKRLVRQISNGDYYEPKNPSSASPLIRDMLTVDPLKRADISYICDHPWVNTGCETSCLEMSEMLAAETPVRLDLLLSLAPAAPSHCNSVMVPPEADLGPEESCTDLTSSTSMAVEPSNSAEKRILELVAEGGEDAIKPSPTRTIVAAGENKRKLDIAASASGLQRKKERVASCASIAQAPALPEEGPPESPPDELGNEQVQPTLTSSATMTISPAPAELAKDATVEIVKQPPKEEEPKEKTRPRVASFRKSKAKADENQAAEKQEDVKAQESKASPVVAVADQLTGLSLAPAAPATPPAPAAPPKPKKLSIPGGNVGSFKEQFERRASLTAAPEIKRNVTKPVVSKIAKPKAQSEDRELSARAPENNGTVRLQQIGIEPSPTPVEESNRMGVKKTESEPSHSSNSVDPSVLLQDARRSLQNSMAKLVEEKASEESRRRAARDIISTAIRSGKPPVPYGRSSSAGVTSLASPPGTPPSAAAPRVFRTEAQHRVDDHRNSANRGMSVERIIPIHMSPDEAAADVPAKPALASPQTPPHAHAPTQSPAPTPTLRTPFRRLTSTESGPTSAGSEACASPGEPIKKSAREFIIPIAVEGKGYVTPRQRSLEPDANSLPRLNRVGKPRRISSLVSGGESEEEDDTHMHRLRSSRAARAESVSSGEEDEEDEGFHLLTAENLFSTLLHRVRALTNRLNGEEGPGFPQSSHSLFNNLQSPFFNSPHLPRKNLFTHRYVENKRSISETREGWGSRDMHAPFDSMFSKRAHAPRGNTKKSGKPSNTEPNAEEPNVPSGLDLSDLDLSAIQFSEKEMRALSGLTPALSRRLQRQLLAHLPPAAARSLRRTLSLRATPAAPAAPTPAQRPYSRSHSAGQTPSDASPTIVPEEHKDEIKSENDATHDVATEEPTPETFAKDVTPEKVTQNDDIDGDRSLELQASQFCTLPRVRRRSSAKESSSPPSVASDVESAKIGAFAKEPSAPRGGSVRGTPDRSLLSKYLTPERALSLDESYSSDGGSILSEPSYIAAYGSPAGGGGALGFRRHSMRLTGDQPRRRVSRFLRSDFFDTPPDESVYAKHKKEKELETQKILKEIREKKSKSLESSGVRSPDARDVQPLFKDDHCTRKCLSPVSSLIGKERSRSTTPFFPILDNIKETNLDSPVTVSEIKTNSKLYGKLRDTNRSSELDEHLPNRELKVTRPKSYPVKNLESFDESNKNALSDKISNRDSEPDDKKIPRESKLIRPKSYPASSPSPEKVYVNRNTKKEDKITLAKEESSNLDSKADFEVSFNITLPRKHKSVVPDTDTNEISKINSSKKDNSSSITVKKYQVINPGDNDSINVKDSKNDSETSFGNGVLKDNICKTSDENDKMKNVKSNGIKNEEAAKSIDFDLNEKKGTVKKKIIKKVSKSKNDLGTVQESNDNKKPIEKKKVTKKIKDKSSEDSSKPTVTKKKSVLQSIGHKLEKLASSKSNSPEKSLISNITSNDLRKDSAKMTRSQREQSVPVSIDPPAESNVIKRAVTTPDVAALENQNPSNNKTTVSKVLGLFKKFDSREKVSKSLEKSQSVEVNEDATDRIDSLTESLSDKDKPRRPTSLLLNGLGRKNKLVNVKGDNPSVSSLDNDENPVLKKDNESKNMRNSLKLDFSRLPRVKKIVPTNPVIEPQIMNTSAVDKETENIHINEKNGTIPDGNVKVDIVDLHSRSRSRSRSTYSNSDVRSENSAEIKYTDRNPFALTENSIHSHTRHHESTTPEKEDVVDRIRRKSFYSRFNEKKQRRKSNLVGPGAAEYDPVARIHSLPTETKFDVSPTSPGIYDLSPGFSVSSDLSPSTDRHRTLLTDLPRNNLRYDVLNDKIDTYRSLDRNDFRKYSGSRSYLDYDQPLSYGGSRYSRTKSLLDSADGAEDHSLSHLREPLKYNRTHSLYTPGSYATYRPKRTLNSAIILKGEKEPSPENILDKIRQRKISISVTRKPDSEKDPLPRSTVTPQGEGDGAERSEKID